MNNIRIEEGLSYYKEYITEPDKVKVILKKHNFKMEYNYNVDEHMSEMKYNYNLKIGRFSFPYSEGSAHEPLDNNNEGQKVVNAVHCLLLDTQAGTMDFDEFVDDFGYNEPKEAYKIWKQCQHSAAKMMAIFTSEELETLQENIQL